MIAYLGVAAGTVSGVMAARRKNMDAVGAVVVAFLTALGGGTLRDMLLGRGPVFWIREEGYAYLTLILAVAFFYSTRLLRFSARSILIPDALGLGVFTVMGVEAGLADGTSWFIASLMGVITGVFGGVLRDVLCNEVPQAFSDHRPYALCAFAGGWVDVALRQFEAPDWAPLLACVLVTGGLRVLALWRNWQLPAWRV